MFKIESDTRRLKHDVLTRVAELAYQGKLNSETIDEIPFEIIPGRQPHFRCCVYKEREIIHQRVRLAMGKMPNGMQPTTAAVTVIPAACEGCLCRMSPWWTCGANWRLETAPSSASC